MLRSLALARALEAKGAACAFATGAEGARLLDRFAPGWTAVGTEPADADAWGADAVVFDAYDVDAAGEAPFARPFRLVAAVDDLADRPHAASLLIDPSFGRDPAAYEGLLRSGAEVLAGPCYALLRPEFAAAGPVPVRERVERVFVSFGLADPKGVTGRTVADLLPALPGVAVDVALGAGAGSLGDLRRLAVAEPRLTLHVETDRAAALMARADLAVGAGGASTWERCVLGLPSVCVIVADNQRALAHALADADVQVALEGEAPGFEAALTRAVVALAADPGRRSALARAGRALCDGRGAGRAAEAILGAIRRLRAG